jgi:hypothetical protein
MTNEEVITRMWEAYKAGGVYAPPKSNLVEGKSFKEQSFDEWIGDTFPKLLEADTLKVLNIETNHGNIKM